MTNFTSCKSSGLYKGCLLQKMWKMMKLTTFLLLISTLSISAKSYSQVNLSLKDASVKTVFSKIRQQTGSSFLWAEKTLENLPAVNVSVRNASLSEALKASLKDLPLTYDIHGNVVYIKRKKIMKTASDPVAALPPVHQIIGTVTDSATGSPLVGVTVQVKGSTTGTTTDAEGKFSLPVPDDAVLVVSYIGYRKKEIPVNGERSVNIRLTTGVSSLNQLVVVGYGTQKKKDLTGAVSSISEKDIRNRPITQASQALAGLSTGIIVSQGSGQPGNDGAAITIRGMGSYGAGGQPLVLVDGLATSINDVDPNNIATISILKDAASASIYGSRAANGVILIETKRGKEGKVQVNYNGYAGWQHATQLPDFLPSWEYAVLRNEANINMGASPSYTDEEIEKFKNQSDPDNYPNVPHYRNLLTSGTGFQTGHNLTVLGGNKANRYLFSMSYTQQDGIVAKNGYKRYNFRFNDDGKITDGLTFKINLDGYTAKQHSPRQYDGGMNNMINFAVREGPVFAGKKSDGSYGYQDNYSPEAWMASGSFYKGSNKYFLGSAELKWEPFKGFTISGKAGYNFWSYYNKDYAADFQFDSSKYIGPNNLSVTSGQGTHLTLQSIATYNMILEKHSFRFLAGISQEQYNDRYITGFRKDFPTNLLYELNAGSATGMTNGGTASGWSMRSFFGRFNYSFSDKYLFEANIRADGTSRFPPDGRWGYFPSFSAGWRISEEPFIKDNISWIENLKLRISWGELGNQNIGTYPYQNIVSLGQNYSFGGVLASGAATTKLSNNEITWENTLSKDFGIDMDILRGKFSFVVDVFDKNTTGVLYTVATSAVLGVSTSPVNVGSVKNTGIEIALAYHKNLGDFNMNVSPNFSFIKNRVTSLANGKKRDIGSGLFVGQPIGVIYGYVADGLFVDRDDIKKYPKQPYSAEPGFVRYKDINGPDGVPDGIVDATYDRTIIGNTMPKYTYGLTFTANYKGFDLYVLGQGLGGYQKQIGSYEAFAFYNGGQIQRWQAENRWTEDNPDPAAKYPKLTSLNMGSGTIMPSTYWIRNASFVRLKSLQIGYSLPESLIDRMRVNKIRIYFSGQNLLSLNHFYKGWDPEMSMSTGDNSSFYPLTRVYTFGINVTF